MRWTRKLGPLRVVVERTTCVVRASTTKDVLINAANESLVGAQLPYFPRGGPCPPPLPEGLGNNANSWGALETGPGFVFREHAVDGVVSSLGGKALRDLCARARPDGFAAGDAVATAAPGLPFETLVHAVAPFWESVIDAATRRACAAAFALAAGRDVAPRLAARARAHPSPAKKCRRRGSGRRRGVGTSPATERLRRRRRRNVRRVVTACLYCV